MTDDYYAQLRDYGGTTPASDFSGGGQSLNTFFDSLKTRARKPLVDYGALTAAQGGPQAYNPFSLGRAVGQSSTQAFQPAPPPERYNVNLLGESIAAASETAIGQGFLGTPGAQRGGVMSVDTGAGSFGLATTPANFQNFATYAREAPLSLITGALGHKYQQPVAGAVDPVTGEPITQPQSGQTEDILQNISQGDFGGVLDNIIAGINAVGHGVADVASYPVDRYREANAIDRGRSMRSILATGNGADWSRTVMMVTSLFDQSRFSWAGIVDKAKQQGLDPLDMAAELWDLSPAVVRQIAQDPTMDDAKLEKLVKLEPFSYDPGINVAVELAANIAPLLVGGGLVRGTGFVAQGILGAEGILESAAVGAGAGRLIAGGLDTFEGIRAAGLIGKPILVAGRIGAWSLPKAWRAVQMAETLNRTSLILGTSIRFGEWGIKQAFEIGGNDAGVAAMDAWLWEMPLSNNPGLMLVDAFAVHPLRTGKALYRGAKDVATLKLMGGSDLALHPAFAANLGSVADMPLEGLQTRIFDQLGWDAASVGRLFGEDATMGATDVKNGLLYVAAQIVRARHEARLRFMEPTADLQTRNNAFWRTYGDEAAAVLNASLTGRGKDAGAIVNAIKTEFWTRKNLIDASELGNEGMIGPYDGAIALDSFASWVRASKKVRDYGVTDQVLKLREDVNRQVVAAYREQLSAMDPGAIVPVRTLNEIKVGIPSIVRFGGGVMKRRGETGRKVTARQLLKILDQAESEQSAVELRGTRPVTKGTPALRPEDAQAPMAVAKAFSLRQDTVTRLMETAPEDLTGPIPNDLSKVLVDVYRMNEAEARRYPEKAWAKISEWWQRTYPDSVARGEAISNVDRFAKIVQDRYAGTTDSGLDAEAFRRINDTLTHPYRPEEGTGPVAESTIAGRNDALSTWIDETTAWLDAPERGLRVVTGLDGTHYVELPGFTASDAIIINRLAERAAAFTDLTPEQRAILADPLAHPLEKVGPIRDAVASHPEFRMTDAESSRLRGMGDLEGVYGSTVKDVLGEDATVSRDTVDAVTKKAVASAEEIDNLREQARSLAQVIDRGPTRHLTPEYADFVERAQVLGTTKIGRGRPGEPAATVDNWRSVPLTPAGVRAAATDFAVSNARAAATARLERATTGVAEADAALRRVSTIGDGGFRAEDVTWAPDPITKFPTRKAAVAEAKLAMADGTIYGVRKVGSRWGLFKGEYTPSERPVAAPQAPSAPATPEAAPAAAPARLNLPGPAHEGPQPPAVGDAVVIDGQKYRIRVLPGDQPGDSAVGTIYLAKAGPSWKRAAIDGGVHAEDKLVWDKVAGLWRVERLANRPGPKAGPLNVNDLPPESRAILDQLQADEAAQPSGPVPAWEQARLDRTAAEDAARTAMREKLATEPPRTAADLSTSALTEAQDYVFGRSDVGDAAAREAANQAVIDAAQRTLIESGARPEWIVDWSHSRMGHAIKVRWEGDVPIPDEPLRDTTPELTGTAPLSQMLKEGEPLTRFTALTQEAIDLERAYRAESHKNTSGWYWNRAAQARIKKAEATLGSVENQRLRDYVPPEGGAAPAGGTMFGRTPAEAMTRFQELTQQSADLGLMPFPAGSPERIAWDAAHAPIEAEMLAVAAEIHPVQPGPPPIVERISEAQRIREAQVEALQRERVAQEAAATEAQATYEAGRVLPPQGAVELGQSVYAEIIAKLDTLAPDDQVGYDALVEKYGLENVSAADNLRETARDTRSVPEAQLTPDELQAEINALGPQPKGAARRAWQEDVNRLRSLWVAASKAEDSRIADQARTDAAATAAAQTGLAAKAAREVTFLDPIDNKTAIRARVVLVDADALLTSDRPGFPPNLQPRSRGVRASSDEQILTYAQDIQPGKLFGTTEGATGMPVVMESGAVLAGNGRVQALRLAPEAQYAKYRAAMGKELAKYGYTPEDIAKMKRPLLIRELIDSTEVDPERLAWQLNEMPVGDLAPSVAAALRPSDIREFKVGDEQSLGDAIRSPANTPAVARMIGRLPRDWHARYFDPKTGLNEPGAKLLEATLLSKVLRADDRAAPGFQSARAVVFQIAEQGGEDIRRISGGIAEGAAQLVKAYELADSGAIAPDILTFGQDLAPALARIIELRDSGLNMEGVSNALDNVTAFDQFTLTPTQTTLAKLLAASTTQKEVRTFMRGVARAAEEGPVQGQEAMFADIPQVDYTGLLNEGVRAWNAIRPDGGQMDYFASTEAPYDIPLGTGVSEDVLGGTQGPARMTQPLAREEVAAEIAARTEGEAVTFVPETVEQTVDAPRAALVMPSDPMEAALYRALLADWDGVHREYADIYDTLNSSSDPKFRRDAFDELLASANDGSITPAEWLALRSMTGRVYSGGGIRVNRAGKYNMKMVSPMADPDTIALGLQHIRAQAGRPTPGFVEYTPAELADITARAQRTYPSTLTPEELARIRETMTPEQLAGEGDARPPATVIHPQPQLPITAEEHAAVVGPDVPFEIASDRIDTAIASTEHTIITSETPALNRAVRAAVGAPAVEDTARRLIEVHAPDAKRMAESIEARRQAHLAAQEAARQELASVDALAAAANDGTAPTIDSVFPDAETRALWDKLMKGSDVDQLARAMGSHEPSIMGELADAVESIDRGHYADPLTGEGLTPPEAMNLRTHLMRVLNGELDAATRRQGGARLSRFTRTTARPPDPFDAAQLQDRSSLIMDDLANVVRVDPNLPPIEGFLGAQYVLSAAPKLNKAQGGRLSPRLLFRDHFATGPDEVIPSLTAELEVGRMEDWPRRVANARGVRLLDHIIGPRSEKEIRAKAFENFRAEIAKHVDADLTDEAGLKRIDQTIDLAIEKWRTTQDQTKFVGFQQYRRISLMGPETLNRLFNEAVDEQYPGGRPAWVDSIYGTGTSPAKLWRRADNRIRNYIAESGMPLSSRLEAMYGKAADLGERPGRAVTVAYHFARFLMDIRWLGLEAIEPMFIAVPRGGAGSILEASALRRVPGAKAAGRTLGLTRTGEPLAFGVNRQQLAMREYAHWAASGDMEQGTNVRWRYLISELAREQRKPFRDTLKTMMREEPGLARIVNESDGGNVDAFLARLDRDWQLAEQGTKEFKTTGEAAAFFKRWRDDGIIDDQTYEEFVSAKRYTSQPAIEAELAKTMADPVTEAVINRLAAINQSLHHDLTSAFFGQDNRSNLQRAANHPFLFWPISYQIKATKWLLKIMLDEAGGVDTGAAVGATFQKVYDEHRRRWVAEPAYRARFAENRTVYFLAGMIFPIIPTELGVSLSPFTRMTLNPTYNRPFGVMGVGPVYTNLALIPRLIAEQSKPGEMFGSPDLKPIVDKAKQFFPQSLTIGQSKPTSTIEAQNQTTIAPGSVPVPYQEPIDRANP